MDQLEYSQMLGITYFYELEQNTPEWFEARGGIPTASCAKILLTSTGKIAKGKTVKRYAYKLAAERETGIIEQNPQTYHMMRGHYEEGIAAGVYDENIDQVTECGFITRDFGYFKIGASPDRIIDLSKQFDIDGGIEIKSRISTYQMETIVEGVMDKDFYDQIQFTLLTSGREWWDFVQYSNGMPLYIERIYPNIAWQETMLKALFYLEKEIREIQKIYREKIKSMIKTEYIDHSDDSDDVIQASEVNNG